MLRCHLNRQGIQHLLLHVADCAAPVDASIQCPTKQSSELTADLAGKQIGSKRPVLNHHDIGATTIGSSVSGILLPLTALVTKGSNDHALGGVDGCQVKRGEIGRHGLNLYGFLDGLRGRVSLNLLPSTL
jgi:hypothetical protein